MPIMAKRPITRSFPIVAPAPMVAPSRTNVGSVSSSKSLGRHASSSGVVARGKRSFVNVTFAATITPSSIVTPVQT